MTLDQIMMTQDNTRERKPVWSASPSVSSFYGIYGLVAIIATVLSISFEAWLGVHTTIGAFVFPSTLKIGVEIPYPVEIFTVALIFLIYLAEAIKLAFLRIRNKYELYDDGLYLDTGIVNLRNVYVSPNGFLG